LRGKIAIYSEGTLFGERNIVPFRVPGEAAKAISVEGN
jgi:hypothetical protein